MVNATHTSFNASDRSYYAIIKKEAHAMAAAADYEPKRIAELDLVIAELTTNLYKYADQGEILIGHFREADNEYIEVICMDEGPGMNDVKKMSRDGVSTTNTLGHGLGSIKRFSDKFDIYSLKGWGTLVLSRIYKKPPAKAKVKPTMEVRPLIVNKPGETACGDGFCFLMNEKEARLLLADGLGHGPDANLAMNEAVNAFRGSAFDLPVDILRYMHSYTRKTRGVVATIITFNFEKKTFNIAGIGNIATKLVGFNQSKSHLSYNGIVGHTIPNTMNDQAMSFEDYQQFILCSDGIRSRWDLSKYPGIQKHDLTLQAAAIYKDFNRRTDDTSIVIAKLN
jgi:anti-sigma regulatory factor (Ser/Thr protein kinase)